MSKGIQFPLILYKSHKEGTLEMVFLGEIHRYDSLLVNDMEELEAGEEMGYIDSYHDAIFGIETADEQSEEPDQESKDSELDDGDPLSGSPEYNGEEDEESESETDSEADEEF